MKNNKRIFYLDLIRAIATITIVLTHYNALFIYNVPNTYGIVGSTHIFKTYIGDFGVSLFLILSGASLMVSVKDNFSIKEYYKKRFKKIFPIFWFVWILLFLYGIVVNGSSVNSLMSVSRFNIIYTLLGIDGYVSVFGLPTFYIIGEWFLGFIIIFYLIFPLLYKCMNKFPKLFAISTIFVYFVSVYLLRNYMYSNILICTRILELVFGMYFGKYIKNVEKKYVILCIILLILNQFINYNINVNIRVSLVGISAFVIFAYLGKILEKCGIINRLCIFISKKSFLCFLLHHWVIYKILNVVPLSTINRITSFIIFISLNLIILFYIFIVEKLYNATKKEFNYIFFNKKQENMR